MPTTLGFIYPLAVELVAAAYAWFQAWGSGCQCLRVPAKPKRLADILGPPPPVRDLAGQEEALPGITCDELQNAASEPLAQAMLLQANALTSLVGQLASGSADPFLEAPSSSSGFSRREALKIQADLALRDGSFFDNVLSAATRRMDPAMMPGTLAAAPSRDPAVMTQLVGIALDLFARGEPKGAAYTVALLAVFIEQSSLDSSPDLAWLLTHLPDPPNGLFLGRATTPTTTLRPLLRPFSLLADQKLVATTLACVKELDTVSLKRSEFPKAKFPPKALPKKDPATPDQDPALSRKQLRAKLWAAKKAGEAQKALHAPVRMVPAHLPRVLVFSWSCFAKDFPDRDPHSSRITGMPFRAAFSSLGVATGISPYVNTELLMPFREPATLRGIPPNSLPFPDTVREDRKELLEIFSLWGGDPLVCGSFSSLFQGDHAGVEFATCGCRRPRHRRLFLCLSAASKAKAAYAEAQLSGSDHKDNWGSLRFTVPGAEVDSSLDLVENGAVLVAAPLHRRLALSFVTLKMTALPAVSEILASTVLGGWVSFVQFRRPFSCFLDAVFGLAAKVLSLSLVPALGSLGPPGLAADWEILSSWAWSSRQHINELESNSVLVLYKKLALAGGDLRSAVITDSSVVLGSHTKGRSSAKLIRRSLQRAGCTIIAGGLYPSVLFSPTRWNAADDPTRSTDLRAPFGFSLCKGLSREELRALSSLRLLTRARANWLLLALPEVSLYDLFKTIDFDKTLGFPGEGTTNSNCCLVSGNVLSLIQPPTGYNGSDVRVRWHMWWFQGYCNAFRHDGHRRYRTSVGLGGNVSKSLAEVERVTVRDGLHSVPPIYGSVTNDAGNGSIMRLAPVPIAYHLNPVEAMEKAILQSRATHPSCDAAACCAFMAFFIAKAIRLHSQGLSPAPQDFIASVIPEFLASGFQDLAAFRNMAGCGRSDGVRRIRALLTCTPPSPKEASWDWKSTELQIWEAMKERWKDRRYNGHPIIDTYWGAYCMDGLAMALWALWHTDCFSRCILQVVNLLGDADTTGAVAGQMAGALYGWQAVAGDEWGRSRLFEVQRWDPYAEIGVRAALLYHLFPAGREVQLCQREGHATIRVFDHPSEHSRSLVGEIKSETRVQQRSLFGNFAKVMGKDLYDRDICGWVGIKNVLFLRDRGEGTELVSFL
ncbi:tri1 [Symbiodinium sp. KB8]|nr:tri1 [Symbiodinium sp. KB8]